MNVSTRTLSHHASTLSIFREELARQNYQRLQLECKTDQAQKDLARLAITRKKREEEAAKNATAPAPK